MNLCLVHFVVMKVSTLNVCVVAMQVHVLSWLVPFIVRGFIFIGKSGGDITDNRLRELHCPELYPVFWAIGHNIF